MMNEQKIVNSGINEIFFDFKQKYSNLNEENWETNVREFLENILHFSSNIYNERIVYGWIASLCEKAYFTCAYKKDLDTRLNFESNFNRIIKEKKLPKFLTCMGPVLCGKRQPSFIDAIDPTFERYQVMENLPQVFGQGVDAIIIGGSMSYGHFFSVRSNEKDKDFSDIDGVVVVNDLFFNEDNWNGFIKNGLFPEAENKLFFERMKVFRKLLSENKADVLSQRFSVVGKDFTVSLHFILESVFEKMICSDLENSLKERVDVNYVLRDFRVDSFTHPCLARHTFNGGRFESVIDGYKLDEGGYVSFMPGYTISAGKFYPGVYQTVIHPSFLVFYDRNGQTTNNVNKFQKLIYKEVEEMRKLFPFSTYSKAHNRYDIFEPGRYEEGLNSFIAQADLQKYLPYPDFNIIPVGKNPEKEIVALITEKQNLINEKSRKKAQKSLTDWKRKTLLNASNQMMSFRNNENSEQLLKFIKSEKRRWYTICFIGSQSKMVKKIPIPYYSRERNLIVDSEIYIQTISAREVMRLDEYEELSKKYGRVFVASVMDPGDETKVHPTYYALIIRT